MEKMSQKNKKGINRGGILVLAALALLLLFIVIRFTQSMRNSDMIYGMTTQAEKHLQDVKVELIGQSHDCYYFIVDSSNIDQLNQEELRQLYDDMNLEHVKVVYYTSKGKRYYLYDEKEKEEVLEVK